ncbi:hypothetical protein ACOSP7_011507 [Xanthoceras sorbifolium]
MADPRNHLEKMGRELKCPVCLSLLNSSVSLPCNHVFCNSCIVKSMKSASDCPVCKLPYHRREVRAAPHMDSLVNIYKSMEIASGINIFVTQNEPSAKSSDKERQIEGDTICGDQVLGAIGADRAENQTTSNRKRQRRTTKSNVETTKSSVEPSSPVSVKPSFPTKKRVQVAHYPLPETPIQPAKFEGGLNSNTFAELKDSSIMLKDKSDLKGPVLSPFFWLREEEDGQKSSQRSDDDTYITPPDIPTFSDIKDSDDKNSYEFSPTVEMHGELDGVDLFDSEMFEWTQRPCSPELLPSPVKMQVAGTNEIEEKKLEAASRDANTNEEHCHENVKWMTSEQGNGIVDEVQRKVSSSSNINSKNQTANGKPNKRGRKAKQNGRNKCAKKDADQDSEIHVDSKEESDLLQKQVNDSIGGSLVLKNTRKRNKKVGSSICATEPRTETVVPVSFETVDQDAENRVLQLPASLDKKQGSDEDLQLKNEKHSWKINRKSKEDCYLRSKRRKIVSTEVNMPERAVAVQNQTDEDTIQQSLFRSICMDNDKGISAVKKKHSKGAGKINSALNSKFDDKLRCKNRMEVSFHDISKGRLVDHKQDNNVSMKETQSAENAQCTADVRVMDDSSRAKKLLKTVGRVLQKCEILSNKIQCAFCHSSEDSEASGEMIHYYNGKPVAADYNSGSKVIHSHRNCTEWAPNVYFEEDTAINLESELARSRRIKCCCCGLKGAALGCYEKSCRRSFHVPCAKLTLQCRWDTDNFVILCPIHALSKLPNENSKLQESRKKCISKVQLQACCDQVATDIGTNYSWKSSQDKLVLCCSALTAGEKEIVSKFERLSKVTVLSKWNSRVTHVIASTDENGACRRTLKVLMGILEGKWILNIEWVKACMKAMKPVDEEQYEIVTDTNGIRGGPRLGRMRILNEQPKLFDGLKFYLMGGFISSYKGYLQDLVIAAGGTILHRKPISRDQGALLSDSSTSFTFIIYSLELPEKFDLSKKNMLFDSRRSIAEVLANSTGAKAVSNLWVLNSIAACKLQSYV